MNFTALFLLAGLGAGGVYVYKKQQAAAATAAAAAPAPGGTSSGLLDELYNGLYTLPNNALGTFSSLFGGSSSNGNGSTGYTMPNGSQGNPMSSGDDGSDDGDD